MADYSYIRVSTKEQLEDRQLLAIDELNIPKDNIVIEKQSGKDFNRPEYLKLVEKLNAGDVLYIKSIDRLGRNYEEIINQWRTLTKERDIDIVVLDMPLLDTRNNECGLTGKLISDIVLQLLSYVAQTERDYIRQRQAEGVIAARAKGVKFGRPIKTPPENFAALVKLWERGELKFEDLLAKTGLKEATFYRRLREYRVMKKKK